MQKNEKAVSIIVPIYNVEQYVEKCIKSLINQTFKDIEIWAISDGSPDNSIEIVKKLAQKDHRIKCVEKENGGYGSVLEYAISKIETPYFLICDPDDWLEEDAIEKLYENAEKNKVDLVVADKYFIYQEQENKKKLPVTWFLYPIEPNKVYDNLELFSFISVSPHSKLYKTNLAKKIKFPHHVNHTDTILYFIYLINSKNALYLDIPLSNYLADRPGNTMSELNGLSQKTFHDMMIVLNSIYEQLDKNSYLYAPICYMLYNLVLQQNMNTNIEKKQRKENKKEIITYLLKLKPEKKNIKNYIRASSRLKKIVKNIIFELYFCDFTRNLTLNFMIFLKKYWKK